MTKVNWSKEAIVKRREKYYAASQRAFVPFADPIVFRKGKGQYLWDEEGNRYLDMLGMNLCVSVGHAHSAVVEAASTQAAELSHCTTMFHHPVPAHYAEELAATMPDGEDWVVHFTNSGSEAADLALLMARSYTGNVDLLALRSGYHGATLGAQAMSGVASFRHPVPQITGITFLPEPNPYRGSFGESLQPYLDEIDRVLATATSGRLAGIILEPVQGYGGVVPLIHGYLSGAFERVRAAGGVCIVDEVQAGVGRTGKGFWSFEAHGVVPDIIIAAKGLGNGFPVAALIARREVAEAMADKFLFHSYGANPVTCAAGRAVLRVIEEEGLQDNARKVGGLLKSRLEELRNKYEAVGDVRGEGLMLAVELVRDRSTREPDPDTTARVFEECRRNGIIASKSGPYRSVLRMCPPLCCNAEDAEFAADALDRSLQQGLQSSGE